MRKIIYIFIFAIVFLIVKAFYLDKYIAAYNSCDMNSSSEMNQSASENNASSEEKIEERYNSKKKMPLDQLGESIAEKIEDKL